MESKSKYVVAFATDGPSVDIAELPDDFSSVQFALNLHRSSNIKHTVYVFFKEDDRVVPFVTFTLK